MVFVISPKFRLPFGLMMNSFSSASERGLPDSVVYPSASSKPPSLVVSSLSCFLADFACTSSPCFSRDFACTVSLSFARCAAVSPLSAMLASTLAIFFHACRIASFLPSCRACPRVPTRGIFLARISLSKSRPRSLSPSRWRHCTSPVARRAIFAFPCRPAALP